MLQDVYWWFLKWVKSARRCLRHRWVSMHRRLGGHNFKWDSNLLHHTKRTLKIALRSYKARYKPQGHHSNRSELVGKYLKTPWKGYIHCDIKPNNILLSGCIRNRREFDQLYIIDFGISQAYLDAKGNHVPLHKVGKNVGNKWFASPNFFKDI